MQDAQGSPGCGDTNSDFPKGCRRPRVPPWRPQLARWTGQSAGCRVTETGVLSTVFLVAVPDNWASVSPRVKWERARPS